MAKAKTVSAYIAAAPPKARAMMRPLRAAIRSAAPQAEEKISYGMPYYGYHTRLIYFAASKNHIGLYVMGRAKKKFAKDIAPYRTSVATLRFPLGMKIPLTLVKKLVKDRVREIDGKD